MIFWMHKELVANRHIFVKDLTQQMLEAPHCLRVSCARGATAD